jgi:hypothetical protein
VNNAMPVVKLLHKCHTHTKKSQVGNKTYGLGWVVGVSRSTSGLGRGLKVGRRRGVGVRPLRPPADNQRESAGQT